MPSTSIHLKLDRDLPVPLGAQLHGLVEYGIACGELRPGDRLLSVRELAEEVSVAPMTVAQVYRDLKDTGLIEGGAGPGTFVAPRTEADALDRRRSSFHRRIDALVDEGLAMGLRSGDIAGLIAARLSARQARGRSRSVVLVWIFPQATACCAQAVAAALSAGVTVEPLTIDALQRNDAVRPERPRPISFLRSPIVGPRSRRCCRVSRPGSTGSRRESWRSSTAIVPIRATSTASCVLCSTARRP